MTATLVTGSECPSSVRSGLPFSRSQTLSVLSCEAEIASRDLPYETAVVQETTSAALPLGFDPSVGFTEYLAFTDRVVILRRSDVTTVETAQGLYAASFPLSPQLELVRGWIRAQRSREPRR